MRAFNDARDDASIGVIILTGMVIHSFLFNSHIFIRIFGVISFLGFHGRVPRHSVVVVTKH